MNQKFTEKIKKDKRLRGVEYIIDSMSYVKGWPLFHMHVWKNRWLSNSGETTWLTTYVGDWITRIRFRRWRRSWSGKGNMMSTATGGEWRWSFSTLAAKLVPEFGNGFAISFMGSFYLDPQVQACWNWKWNIKMLCTVLITWLLRNFLFLIPPKAEVE